MPTIQEQLKKIEKEFVEKGADLEHDRWARWQNYMFSKGQVGQDGVFHLPKEFVDRWFRQIATPYSKLSEEEKESDRRETRNYLPLLRTSALELVKSVVEEELKRWEEVKLDMDVIICECGEPYKDTDPADKINDSITNLKETLKEIK